MVHFLAGMIFLISGIAGLADEIVWFRMLTTVFGASAPAIAATTGAFMAGLAAGSALAANRRFVLLCRCRRPSPPRAPTAISARPSLDAGISRRS